MCASYKINGGRYSGNYNSLISFSHSNDLFLVSELQYVVAVILPRSLTYACIHSRSFMDDICGVVPCTL